MITGEFVRRLCVALGIDQTEDWQLILARAEIAGNTHLHGELTRQLGAELRARRNALIDEARECWVANGLPIDSGDDYPHLDDRLTDGLHRAFPFLGGLAHAAHGELPGRHRRPYGHGTTGRRRVTRDRARGRRLCSGYARCDPRTQTRADDVKGTDREGMLTGPFAKDHKTAVEPDGDEFRAVCSCEWRCAVTHKTEKAAEHTGMAHKIMQRLAAGDSVDDNKGAGE